MTIALAMGSVSNSGADRTINGTFTSNAGDSSIVITKSTHGLAWVKDATVTLDPGGIATPIPKMSISNDVVTAAFQDTQGYSGRWIVRGR